MVLQLCCCLKRCVRRKGSVRQAVFNTKKMTDEECSSAEKRPSKLANLTYFVDSEYNQFHNKM